jgi:hypothetical protein
MVRALCNELMRCSLMCSLIKAIYLLATEHTLEFSRMYFDRPHYVLHNHSLMAASSSSPPPPRSKRYVQNANKQEAFGKGLGVNMLVYMY